MSILDLLTTFWMNWIMLPSFILGIIGLLFYVYSIQNKKINRKRFNIIGIYLIILFVFNWLIGFSLSLTFETLVKKELISFLNQPNIEIKINGKKLVPEYSTRVVSELKEIKSLPGHHSSPKDEIELKIISDKDSMTLTIKQDSEKEYEFWVFSDKYNHTKENDIGKLKTLVFIRYYNSNS